VPEFPLSVAIDGTACCHRPRPSTPSWFGSWVVSSAPTAAGKRHGKGAGIVAESAWFLDRRFSMSVTQQDSPPHDGICSHKPKPCVLQTGQVVLFVLRSAGWRRLLGVDPIQPKTIGTACAGMPGFQVRGTSTWPNHKWYGSESVRLLFLHLKRPAGMEAKPTGRNLPRQETEPQ
jgi:hypothetical protein